MADICTYNLTAQQHKANRETRTCNSSLYDIPVNGTYLPCVNLRFFCKPIRFSQIGGPPTPHRGHKLFRNNSIQIRILQDGFISY